MAKIDYKLYQVNPIGLEQLSEFDLKTVGQFSINTNFTPFEDKVELHIYGQDNVRLESFYDHRNFKFLQGSETVGITGASEVSLDPIQDSVENGFELGGVKLVYNFLDNLYSEEQAGGEFFIQDISEDRTEVRLLSNQLTEDEVVDYTEGIIEDLNSDSYFNDFRLNVKNNDLLIGLNIKIQDYRKFKSVVVKLYEPLPQQYQLKQLLTIDRLVADSAGYAIETTVTPDVVKPPTLKGPNFNLEEPDSVSYPTAFLNTDELFSFPTNNTYREVNSLFKEKGIEVSINYADLSNFIHFSSAEERLRNFQYKLNLIESYQLRVDSSSLASGFTNTDGDTKYWTDKIESVIQNFDHYDRHLYFQSGSTSWPKAAPQTKPYINATGATTSSFITDNLLSASYYDANNNSSLINTIPDYLREDTDSSKYSIFTHMLGQHFDNIWIYTKALSDKYDNDNRRDYGISKDMVQESLKNFGVKLYNNFQSTDDLFNTFTGKLYSSSSIDFEQSGSNIIASLATPGPYSVNPSGSFAVSGSEGLVNVDSLEDYKRDINKRIYHNLPFLLKTKGTERGLKALIAAFGVPTDNNMAHYSLIDKQRIKGLNVRTVGGTNRNTTPYFGPSVLISSSFDRIKIDNTGSIASGSTLSNYTSILSRDEQYTDDIHTIEVGFSPTYELNEKLISASSATFNIDNLIGDPRQVYSGSYSGLISESNALMNPIISTGTVASEIGDGFKVANVSHVNNFASGDYQYRVQLSQSVQNSGSNPHNPDSDASDIPKANNSGYLKADGGGYVAVNNTPSWGLVQASTGTKLNAVNNSNTFTLTSVASGQIYPGGIVRQQGDSTYSGSINGQTVTAVKLNGGSYFKKHNVTFSNSHNNIIAFKVTGGPHTIPAGTELNISQTQWEMHTDTQIDDSIYSLSGSYGVGNMFGYTVSTSTTGYRIVSSSLKPHNYGELVRYLRYYDNVLFKMIKDFVPARSNIDTGLIIKPHLLERNKIKQVKGEFETILYTGSINTAFISGSEAGAFTHKYNKEFDIPLTASYTEKIVAPVGVLDYDYHEKERTRYDGEFSGSGLDVYKHSLNDDNDWKYDNPGGVAYSGKRYCFVTVPPSPTPTATPTITPTSSQPAISVTPTATPSISVTPSQGIHVQRFEYSTGSNNDVCDDGSTVGVCSEGWDEPNLSVRWFYKTAGDTRLYPQVGDVVYRASTTSGDSQESNVTGTLSSPEFSGKAGHITSGVTVDSNGELINEGTPPYTYTVLKTTMGGVVESWNDCSDCL